MTLRSILCVRFAILGALTLSCARDNDVPDLDDTSPGNTSGASAAESNDAGETESDPCITPEGCFDCEPQEPIHYLNRCTEAVCEPFDNAARLPLLNADGSVPPIG